MEKDINQGNLCNIPVRTTTTDKDSHSTYTSHLEQVVKVMSVALNVKVSTLGPDYVGEELQFITRFFKK